MIVTVTPNPALDLTWHVAALEPGSTHRADTGRARAGGKGVNVARVAHAQGASACAVVTHGGATGEEFFAELVASGVPHVTVPVRGATRRSIALVDEAAGDTTIVNERGVALESVEWDVLRGVTRAALAFTPGVDDARAAGRSVADSVREKPDSASETTGDVISHAKSGLSMRDAAGDGVADDGVLVISGSFPPDTPDDVLPSLIALGREAGVPVIVDTSGAALLTAADAGASVLKPNEHELREATGLDDPIDGARELLRRGAELVLLSLGAEGMLAISRAGAGDSDSAGAVVPDAGVSDAVVPGAVVPDAVVPDAGGPDAVDVLHARLGRVLAGNPTGAGDAAVAACAALMDAGVHDPEQILRRATAWSAAAVLMPLAGEIHASWPDLEAAVTIVPYAPASSSAETSFPARDMPHESKSRAAGQVSPPASGAHASGAHAPDSKELR